MLGEIIKITLTEYLQHLLQFGLKITYDPTLLWSMDVKYGSNPPTELLLVPLWHLSVPDEFIIDNNTYSMEELASDGTKIVFSQGLDSMINAMTATSAGQVILIKLHTTHLTLVLQFTVNNVGGSEEKIIKDVIQNGRNVRLQSFNNYRREFGLKPFKTFYEITKSVPLAEKLQSMYFDVDALELPIGLFLF